MLGRLKDYIRTKPRTFDVLRTIMRATTGRRDPAYEFFKEWSAGRHINFIQLGANDGLRNDPFREFILKGWRGILVEPLPDVFELLKRNYAQCSGLTFVNAAISEHDGELPFFAFEERFLNSLALEQRLAYQRKASFDRAHVERYVPQEHRWAIKTTMVPSLSVHALLSQHWSGQPLHLLAMDVEGHEPAIIRSLGDVRPEAIFYEWHTLRRDQEEEVTDLLESRGYRVRKILGDAVALRA